MDAIQMLKEDHRTVQSLFRQFDAQGPHAYRRKEEIVKKTCEELEIHAALEEEIFYPAVQEGTDDEGDELVQESIEEHVDIKDLVKELKWLSADDEQYDAKYAVLQATVTRHIDEEEGDMLPLAEEQLGEERLEELGRQMGERKETLTSSFVEQAKKVASAVVDTVSGGKHS